VAEKDKYGIPTSGNPGPGYVAKKWKGVNWTLSWREMLAAIYLGGWPRELWGMAAAVSAAESSRNPFIYNTLKKGHFGLFQISRSAHPAFFGGSGEDMTWVSPAANAKEGYSIYKSQGWGAWSAKTNGAYLAFYGQALTATADFAGDLGKQSDKKGWAESQFRQGTKDRVVSAYIAGVPDKDINKGAIGKQLLGGIIAGAGGAAEGVQESGAAVAETVDSEFGWLPDLWASLTTPALWMRLGYGALGVVLIAGGLFLVVRNQPAVTKAASGVLGVVPGGAALKAVKKVA
jgi:hypothetical protein